MQDKISIHGLQSPQLFSKRPMVGFGMFIIGSLIFAIIAYNLVYNGLLIELDLPLAKVFHAIALNSPKFIIHIMIGAYHAGLEGLEVILLLLGLYFIWKKFWLELVMLVVASGGGGLLFALLSNIFMRARPFTLFSVRVWSESPNIHGFPSGHAISIVILCGLLLYFFMPKIKSEMGKVLSIFTAFFIIIFIGFSRIYVGDHYLTDIIAGYALGFAWLGLACTIVELIFQKKNSVI